MKGEAELQELPLMLTGLGVAAVLENWPMSAVRFTAVILGAENQDIHESRSGGMRSILPRGSRREPLCAIP